MFFERQGVLKKRQEAARIRREGGKLAEQAMFLCQPIIQSGEGCFSYERADGSVEIYHKDECELRFKDGTKINIRRRHKGDADFVTVFKNGEEVLNARREFTNPYVPLKPWQVRAYIPGDWGKIVKNKYKALAS